MVSGQLTDIDISDCDLFCTFAQTALLLTAVVAICSSFCNNRVFFI